MKTLTDADCLRYWELQCGFNDVIRAAFAAGQQSAVEDAPEAVPDEDDPGCEICHEPLGDGCQCQHSYAREHDGGAER